MKEDDVSQFPLYHGMRSKKSKEEIEREGFCSYGSLLDVKKSILDALRYFGKEKLITVQGSKGNRVRGMIRETERKARLNTYATTSEDTSCDWWAKANPEHISLLLHMIDIPPDKIDKYLNEKYGSNCYNVKLKMTSRGTDANFNTGLNCISPNLISQVRECKKCKYTGSEDIEI